MADQSYSLVFLSGATCQLEAGISNKACPAERGKQLALKTFNDTFTFPMKCSWGYLGVDFSEVLGKLQRHIVRAAQRAHKEILHDHDAR